MDYAILSLPVLALAIGCFNLLTWPAARRRHAQDLDVAVLIPARNEAANIERSVRAALASGAREVWVCDDESTDETPEILARLSAEHERLHVIQGGPLPDGWVGKTRACHDLAQRTSQPWFLFVDADVALAPGAVRGFGALVRRHRADVVTTLPEQQMLTWFERAVVPLLHLTYMSWLPLLLIPATRSTRFLAANGQTLLFESDAYRRVGGFQGVRGAIVDDMAICAAAKRSGLRVLFADGQGLAVCRMYRSTREVWEGFSKNLYLGLGARAHRLAAVIALYLITFLAPFVAVAVNPSWTAAQRACLCVMALRLGIAARFGHGMGTVLLHPLGILGFVGIALNSMRWALAGRIAWRGRTYSGAPMGDAPPSASRPRGPAKDAARSTAPAESNAPGAPS